MVYAKAEEIPEMVHIYYGIRQTNLIKKIYGRTSPIDDQHADRKEHFFNKLGFTIDGRRISRVFK